jgi:glycosyltransferase involved in cell wall biosynthesis
MHKSMITVLHVVGGDETTSGVLSVARQLAFVKQEGLEQRIWKHRDFRADRDPDSYVNAGWARKTNRSVTGDLIAGSVDFVPLFLWARRRPNLILHAHSRAGLIAAAAASRVAAVPLICHQHALARNTSLYERIWSQTAATVVFNSSKTQSHFGRTAGNSLVLMPPIIWPTQGPLRDAVPSMRFVASSSYFRWKRIHLIAEAYELLRGAGLHSHLVINGLTIDPIDAPYQGEMQERFGKAEGIELRFYSTRWLEELRASDVFVHAAEAEPFGIVILEAFSRGCRLVVPEGTFLDDLPEPVRTDGIFRAAVPTAEGFAAAMQIATDSEVDPAELWERRQTVRGLFSAETQVRQLTSLYTQRLGADWK